MGLELRIRDIEVRKDIVEKGRKGKEELLAKTHPLADWVSSKGIRENVNTEEIKDVARKIKAKCEVLFVVGIGGSTSGPKALVNLFETCNSPCKVIFCGGCLDANFHEKMFSLMDEKEAGICVISKSGETLETKLIFNQYEEQLKKKYGKEKAKERIYIMTSKEESFLRDRGEKEDYYMINLPTNVGGRYGTFTGKSLLLLGVAGGDMEEFLLGGLQGAEEEKILQMAVDYACVRLEMFSRGKYVEIFSSSLDSFFFLEDWIQQLFAESEGKEGKGILPIMIGVPEAFHSVGQYIKGGPDIVFETGLDIQRLTGIEKGNPFEKLRKEIMGNSQDVTIEIESLEERTLGVLMYFFQLAASISAYMMGVDPFNQPDVEEYKKITQIKDAKKGATE